jgi:hypothetical protein
VFSTIQKLKFNCYLEELISTHEYFVKALRFSCTSELIHSYEFLHVINLMINKSNTNVVWKTWGKFHIHLFAGLLATIHYDSGNYCDRPLNFVGFPVPSS